MEKIITKKEEETRKFGLKLAKKIKAGDILALIGNLGAGKTTFIQGLAKGLGIKNKITSPTFVQLKIYPASKRGIKNLYHFDFYRLESLSSLESQGLEEYLKNKNGVVVIEWADKIKKLLGPKTKKINFKIKNKQSRIITINKK